VPELRLSLFGAPEARLDGAPLSFDTRKATALLAYLAVTGRTHRREHLAAFLWPESDETRARASLRRTLSVASAVGPALVMDRGEVRLDPQSTWTDVTEFQSLRESGQSSDLQRAAALAADQFLAGFSLRDSADFDDWVAVTAEQLREDLAGVLSRLAGAETQDGRLPVALDYARRWVAVDPLSESAHRELMRIYAWTGQRPAALRQFRSCVRILDRELGVPPLPETSELYDDIRANRLGQAPAAATGRSAQEGMSQVVPAKEDAYAEAFAPSSAPSDLVGRTSERAQLTDKWRASGRAGGAVSLIGDPGMGRTALASAFASEVVGLGGRVVTVRSHISESDLAFVGMIDLVRGLVAADSAVETSLAAIGQPVGSPGELTRMFESVRNAVTCALSGSVAGLLVVDDVQWLDSTSLDLVRYLLHRPPTGVMLLATWRSDFATLDEQSPDVITLRPWNSDELVAVLEHMERPELDPTEVLRRTAGVPRLVVEYGLAAGVTDLAAAPELRELVSARLEAAPPTTRQVLGTVAVLGGVAEPELLRLTSGRDELEVVDAIEDAVARGLLVEDPQRDGYDVPYDAMRSLVLERVSLARLRLLHRRAAEALSRRHTADPRSAPAAVIARHLAAAGQDQEAGAWYIRAAATSRSLYAYHEAIDHLHSALAMGCDPATTHAALGDALTRLGSYDEALVSYEQAAAAIPRDDQHELAVIEHKLAEVHDRLGDWEVARAHLESSAELLHDESLCLRAQVLADLALVMHRQADVASQDVASQALELAERSEDDVALAQVHNVLGVLASGKGDMEAAIGHLESSSTHAQASSDISLRVAALNNLSRVHADMGEVDKALAYAHEALELGKQQGDLHRLAALNDHMADLMHLANRDAEAEEFSKAAAVAFARVDEARARPEIWKLVSW
jgi:DNA-binding SARP family transcriptional activator/tetratricopeptide (TPR) repeat protein